MLSTRGGDSDVAASIEAVAPATSEAAPVSDIEVDVSRLFDAGADETEMSSDGLVEPESAANLQRELLGNTSPSIRAAPERDGLKPPGSSPADTSPADTSPSDTAPTNTAPASTSPTTAAPVTAAPATDPPATAAPTTAAPVTAAPATEPPATDAPATTEPDVAPTTTEASTGEPTGEQWANLRQCESGGNYSIISSNGLYHGAYQFGTGTWDSVASGAGRSDLVGVGPSIASPADQDAMALALWRQRGSQPWPHCGKYLN